ncbi:alpha/beta hydrolase fold domain-containing protein [Lacrimispora sp. 38-1]|uniref:alpha/beta hydrolase fold domain-containing protein n=1 Tax=Lacrimispora sp. 38-1 TaxID=3125778 RepID=UPI003CEF7B8B
MKKVLKLERNRKSITLLDNLLYSTTKDSSGNERKLYLSMMLQHGNVESRLANGLKPDGFKSEERKPVIIFVPGGGYRGSDKNLMVPEMVFMAEAGFAVASIYYRSSSEHVFPAQIEDVLTAVRFLKANADQYGLDRNQIGVMGRSAGGHLAALAGMNLTEYDTKEWNEYSSEVQAVCDWFGPVDVPALIEKEREAIKSNPDYRWKTLEETHPGALMGGDPETMAMRSVEASPPYRITSRACPILIMHGDQDRHVPVGVSEMFYEKLVEAGLEDQTEYYIIQGGNHGSDEFFQPEAKEIVLEFFQKRLKKSE